jgi:MoaA/NifB/PqqE/SkfB family radical SAM enzyme
MSKLEINPYLHVDNDRMYNPLTDGSMAAGDALYASMLRFLETGTASPELEQKGWLIRHGQDLSRSYRLKMVSLETATVCNQKCYFCPVSIDPREDETMPDAMFTSIVEQLVPFRETLEAVFLQSYNEPTVDRRFVQHCQLLFDAGLPVAVLSNGSGLTPAKVDALTSRGTLRYIAFNLSTLDHQRYKQDRGEDHLDVVLRNLDYVKNSAHFAQEMRIVVLGRGDDVHLRDFESIRSRFAGSRIDVQHHVVMDRAGRLDVGLTAHNDRLGGCDNLGSRPIQHLHITPAGTCVLCCEDYDENFVVGDLTRESIVDVLQGERLAQMRRWAYGIERAPDDFICRRCIFARTAAQEAGNRESAGDATAEASL